MPKPSLSIVIGRHMGKSDDDDEASGDDAEYEELGNAFLEAQKSGDGLAVYHALDAIVQECLKENKS